MMRLAHLGSRWRSSAQELDRAVGLGHAMVASGGARLRLVALHGERAHSDDRRPLEIRIGLDLPGRFVAAATSAVGQAGARRPPLNASAVPE
jgi:hypothetical protein